MEKKKTNKLGGMQRWIVGIAAFCAAVGVCYHYPPFRILPLDEARQKRQSGAFDARAFAERLWDESMANSLERAVAAPVLFRAISNDRKAAKNQYARTVGIGSVYYYYVAGTGRVASVDDDSVALSLGDREEIDIIIETSMIFGNAVRNGTGLVNVNDFSNSRDFNNISLELNRIVEERVLPPFRKEVKVGATVRFAGCAEIVNEDKDLHPMRIVPVALEAQ